MTREEFIKVLEEEGYSYKIEGDKIVVTHKGLVWLASLKNLSPDVVFKNGGFVWLESLKTLPPGVEFMNGGTVWLESLKTLPPDAEFRNKGDVNLRSLVGGWFDNWKGNIEGIDNKRLLNLMIKQGVFI